MLCFPDVREVHLRRSPLTEVICQIRFPIILRIADEQPVQFQELIRERFPQLQIDRGLTVEGSPLQAEPLAAKPGPRVFRFISPDDATMVSLSPDFVAVSTTAYSCWNDFAALLGLATGALCKVYKPAYARRLGLRYINRVTFDNTGTSNTADLLEVVRDSLTALLRDSCWKDPPAMISQLLIDAGDNEKLSLRSGFEGGERPALLLDLDYFAEGQIPMNEIMSRCERYHQIIYRAFRWCLREDKLALFDPVDSGKGR